jgi:hypothetical protein
MTNPNNKLFFLGFIAPIPLFIIPEFPFFHFNLIKEDLSWYLIGLPPYTGYTSSLGLAAPLVMLSALFTFFIFISNKKAFQKELIHASILIIIFSSITLYLSNSIKVLGPISSFIGFFMTCFIFKSKYWKSYSFGFLYGISIFCIAHAFSIFFYGFEFSKNSEGISIFSLEIYQALVSYAGLISFFFGTLLLNDRIFKNLPFLGNNLFYERIYYLITLSSTLLILSMTSRRLSVIVCLIACFFFFIKLLVKREYLIKWKNLLVLLFIPIITFFIVNNFFSDNKALTFGNMIEPRLIAYLDKISMIIDSSFMEILFGTLDGWAQIENGIIDIVLSTGIFGLFVFAVIFIYASFLLKNIALSEVKWSKNTGIYFVFTLLVLFLNNTVNNGISTPYFFIPFLILFTMTIKNTSKNEQFYE